MIADRNGRARAYVEIQNGCDHRCTFCIIPYGRGNSRSVGAGAVVEAVRRLAADGCCEVVLTGVDLTSWGGDLPGAPSLGHLVRRILRLVPELKRLRLSSIDAAEIDPELLACLAEEPRLAPHLHLSLQAGDDMILKRMKRRHSRAQSLALIASVRAVRPDTAFGADLIAGFPTETDAMFENTLSLVAEAGLAYLHVFPYSARPGTPAARMPAVARPVVKARAERLRNAGAAGLGRHLQAQLGRTVRGLVERPGLARAEDFTEIAFDGEAAAGAIVPLTVTGHAMGSERLGNPASAEIPTGCQCGAVRFVVETPLGRASICHCRMCQKATGSFFGAFVSGPNLRWTRGAPARFRSSNKVVRGFCAACGTPLTFEWGKLPAELSIGAFDDPGRIRPVIQMDMASRMPWFAELATPARGVFRTLRRYRGWPRWSPTSIPTTRRLPGRPRYARAR